MSFQPEAVRAFEHAGWQRAASSYGNSFAHATAPFVLPLLEAAEISPGQHVLDVACGPGYLAAAAVGRGATAQALDFSAEMVGIARSIHPNIVVTEGDAEDLPYPDCTFHAVVSSFGYQPAQCEWRRSSGRKNHQRSLPLRVTSTVRLNVSAVTRISQFPLQRCWRVVARP